MTRQRCPILADIMLALGALLVALAGCGSASTTTSITARPTPSPTLDPQSHVFLTILHTDYQLGLYHDENVEMTICGVPQGGVGYFKAPVAGKQSAMQQYCLQPYTAIKNDAQALFEHLSAVTPPARWQSVDAEFKQAAQATITYSNKVLAAINAGNVSQFEATFPEFGTVWGMYCDPLAQIDPGLPLDDILGTPKGGICGT